MTSAEPVTNTPAAPAPVAADRLPLDGLRVLDLSWVLSGPISAWTRPQEPAAVVEALQGAGIAAGYFNDVQGLFVDANNRSRNGVVDIDHHVLGYLPIFGTPFHGQPNMVAIRGRAPDLGEHTKEVLVEAQFSPEEIAAYADDDAFESFDIDGEDASSNAVVGNAPS